MMMPGKKQVRAAFRAAVFCRDRYCCVVCGKPGQDRQGGDGHKVYHKSVPAEKLVLLDAHHITDRNEMPNGGYVKENGISLCDDGCHLLAEVYHKTGTAHPGFSPEDLYARIGTSFEEAYRASLMVV
jgi:5-methylcytosine-specific restriction endonuclease McrA